MLDLTPVRDTLSLRSTLQTWRREGRTIGFVPTMGALHEGHLSLVRLAKTRCDIVLASLFVNPAQFGPKEDFDAYPRDEATDASLLAAAGCDILYAPDVETIYPPGFSTTVSVTGLTSDLEGAARPGHFAGVATVVAKLLIQTAPHLAVFGEKDFQQLQTVRQMVRDLDFETEIVGAPIVRAPDGLALSSRNTYLTPEQRAAAPALYRVLMDMAAMVEGGATHLDARQAGENALLAAGFEGVDYLECREPETLAPFGPGPLLQPGRILCAARLGATRLLDNVAVNPR